LQHASEEAYLSKEAALRELESARHENEVLHASKQAAEAEAREVATACALAEERGIVAQMGATVARSMLVDARKETAVRSTSPLRRLKDRYDASMSPAEALFSTAEQLHTHLDTPAAVVVEANHARGNTSFLDALNEQILSEDTTQPGVGSRSPGPIRSASRSPEGLIKASLGSRMQWAWEKGGPSVVQSRSPSHVSPGLGEELAQEGGESQLIGQYLSLSGDATDSEVRHIYRLLQLDRFHPNLRGPQGKGAIHVAAEKGHGDVVSMLLGRKADVELRDETGRRALHNAAQQDHAAVCRLLVDAGADVTALDDRGATPLMLVPGCDTESSRVMRGLSRGPDRLQGLAEMKAVGAGMGRAEFVALMGLPGEPAPPVLK